MKHYVDIQILREFGNEFTEPNTGAFAPGDMISITEKIDGSNASFLCENGQLFAFSRKKELSFSNNLAGFWNWVKESLDPTEYLEEERYIFFGEWLRKNKVVYQKEHINKFYLFDIYDRTEGKWMPQDFVKEEAKKHGLNYVPELYFGPFVSWDHCRSFLNSPSYGETQEGVVVKNLSKINDDNNRLPVYLKIVNDSFKESKRPKMEDREKKAEMIRARILIDCIVTERRVEKMIFKLRDEGILPEVLTPQDMKTVAKNLPKRIYEDCLKEEPEIVHAAEPLGSKAIADISMELARKIIIGS